MPSNAILEQKKQVVADLAEQIKASASGVVVNYQGITVENDTALRKALREAGVKYVVMKNTLTGRACDMCGYSDMKQYLNGMTAIAISSPEDPIAPAKILKEYAEKIDSFQGSSPCEVPRLYQVSYLQLRLCYSGYRRQTERRLRRSTRSRSSCRIIGQVPQNTKIYLYFHIQEVIQNGIRKDHKYC